MIVTEDETGGRIGHSRRSETGTDTGSRSHETSGALEVTDRRVSASGRHETEVRRGEWRGTGVVGWGMEGFDVAWTARFINGVDIASSFGQGSGRPAATGPLHVGSVTYHDVAFSYQIPGNFPKLMLGLENVFDKQPPLFYQYALNANTVVETYDAVGMYAVFRVQQTF